MLKKIFFEDIFVKIKYLCRSELELKKVLVIYSGLLGSCFEIYSLDLVLVSNTKFLDLGWWGLVYNTTGRRM